MLHSVSAHTFRKPDHVISWLKRSWVRRH